MQPTPEALKMLGVNESHAVQKFGNPSLEHEYWKKRVAEHYEKLGYDVEIEKHIGDGKSVDIAASNSQETIAIEIETGKSDAVYNIIKDIEAGFDRVVSVVLKKELKKRIIDDMLKLNIEKKSIVKIIEFQELDID